MSEQGISGVSECPNNVMSGAEFKEIQARLTGLTEEELWESYADLCVPQLSVDHRQCQALANLCLGKEIQTSLIVV